MKINRILKLSFQNLRRNKRKNSILFVPLTIILVLLFITSIIQFSVDKYLDKLGQSLELRKISGIEYLTNLEILDFSGHGLSTVDLSKNTKLRSLNCSDNQLSSLDLSVQNELTVLNCFNNKFTGDFDVSANPKLTSLDCSSNEITELNVSANVALETFFTEFTSFEFEI